MIKFWKFCVGIKKLSIINSYFGKFLAAQQDPSKGF